MPLKINKILGSGTGDADGSACVGTPVVERGSMTTQISPLPLHFVQGPVEMTNLKSGEVGKDGLGGSSDACRARDLADGDGCVRIGADQAFGWRALEHDP